MKRLTKRIGETIYANNINRDAYTNNEDLEQVCIDKTNDIYTKLGQLEDIEEELDIDLITLFKALREKGIWIMWNDQIVNVEPHHLRVEIDCSKPLIGSIKIQELYFEDLDCVMDTTGEEWFMDDYGKTWSLDKQTLEKQ